MVMTALREGASGGILKIFLMGILVLAAGGLVFTDVGGFFRGGVSGSDLAKAGDQKISIQQFDRMARTTLPRLGMTTQQAYQLGYMNELLNNEIRTSLIQQEAADKGIRVGVEQIAQNVKKLIQPMTAPGQAPQDVLQQILITQGMSEGQLTYTIGREMTVNLLNNAVQAGALTASPLLIEDLAKHKNETRNIEYIVFKENDVEIPAPSEAELLEFYELQKESFAIPETREAAIIYIDQDKVKETLEISDEEIQAEYDRNIAQYKLGERRSIEQTIIGDADQAGQIASLVQDGKSLKDATQEVTGNTTDFIPAQDTEGADLLDDIRDPVMEAEKRDVIGPIESGLGNHVIVLKDIKPEEITPLAEVSEDIRIEIEETRLLDAQFELANNVDDYLASGADINAITEELPVTFETLPTVNSFGMGNDGKPVITPKFGPDANEILSTLFDLNENEASPVIELADTRMAAIAVKTINEKSYKSFEDLKAQLEKQWVNDQKTAATKAKVDELINNNETFYTIVQQSGKSTSTQKDIKRDTETAGAFNAASLPVIFGAKIGTPFSVATNDGIAIANVTSVNQGKAPSTEDLTAVENSLVQEQQNEVYQIYAKALEKDHGVKVNDRLLQQAYGQQQDSF